LTAQYTGSAVSLEFDEAFYITGLGTPHVASASPDFVTVARLFINSPLSTLIGGGATITYSIGPAPLTPGVGAKLTSSVSVNWATALSNAGLTTGHTIVVAGETNAAHNGIYVITSGTVLTRAVSFDEPLEMTSGKFVRITDGNYADTGWKLASTVTTVGTSAVNFTLYSSPYIKNVVTGVDYDISYFDGYSAESQPPKEIGRCDITVIATKALNGTTYRGYFSSDEFKGKPDLTPPIPDQNDDISIYNSSKYYGASFYTGATWNKGAEKTIDITHGMVISKKPATITLSNLNKAANGKSEAPKVVTNPPNLRYRLTYNGKLDPPVLKGSYEVYAEITDRNHIGSAKTTFEIGPESTDAIADLKNKYAALGEGVSGSEFVTDTLLNTLGLDEIQSINKLKSLADCAKSLPDKLLETLKNQAIAKALEFADGFGVLNIIKDVVQNLQQVQKIADTIIKIKENPETLLDAVIKKSGLPGEIDKLKKKFPFADIDALLDKGNAICNAPNFDMLGNLLGPKITADPTKTAQPVVKFTPPQIAFDSERKGNYDNFLFQLRDALAKDSTKIDWLSKNNPGGVGEYISMITSINEIAHKHHDDIAKASGTSNVSGAINTDVEAEIARHPEWSPETIAEFRKRAATASGQLEKNTDTIQAYQQRSAPVTGGQISTGVTVYSGPDKDYTTYFDIKPSQRPPEITAYWRSQGKDLEAQEAKLNARGIKTGTLNYSDAFNGAYGKLQSDFTCASTRFKGGSVLALKNPDGTPYNPTGKNVQGLYTVTDTGNAKLTYNKVDIFTSTPEVYKNMDKIGVYLVTEGTKTGKQYTLAQSQFGSAPSSGPVSANV
jgi:hypothetical protein